jgi:hypothetical protein
MTKTKKYTHTAEAREKIGAAVRKAWLEKRAVFLAAHSAARQKKAPAAIAPVNGATPVVKATNGAAHKAAPKKVTAASVTSTTTNGAEVNYCPNCGCHMRGIRLAMQLST